jgi:hypothetical protein
MKLLAIGLALLGLTLFAAKLRHARRHFIEWPDD